jgi:AcrR family transcriptional regulator
MAAGDIELTRSPRASRRRPDAPPPRVDRIPPRSGLSRAEVIANQRGRIFDGFAAALAYHGYEDTKITDIVELAGVSRATFYERFESKELCFAAAFEDGVERLVVAVEAAVDGEAAARPARLEYERSLLRLAEALRPPPSDLSGGEAVSEETARLLAGGLASHVSGRLLAGEAERLPELHEPLLQYLLTPYRTAAPRSAEQQRAARA